MSSAPPSHPKQRARWQPPTIGDYFVRTADLAVFQVKQIDRASQMVQLVGCRDNAIHWPTALELATDYERYGS